MAEIVQTKKKKWDSFHLSFVNILHSQLPMVLPAFHKSWQDVTQPRYAGLLALSPAGSFTSI